MKRSLRCCALLLSICLLLSSCGAGGSSSDPGQAPPAADLSQADAATLLDVVNGDHEALQKPEIDPAQYIPDAATGDASGLFDGYDPPAYDPARSLTLEQTQADLDWLFTLLASLYGPYTYFGGDAAFDAAKEAVLADCAAQGTDWTAAGLEQSLLTHLAFLEDAHFNVNQQRLGQTALPYFYTGAAFGRGLDGYYERETGKVVASVDGEEDLDGLFRPSLTEAGEVIYCPVVLAPFTGDPQSYPDPLTVRYRDGSEQTLFTAPWSSHYDKSERMVELHYNDGIPVLFVRNMGFDQAPGDEMGKAFLDYAEQLKDEPVLILDLRSNGGGNSILSVKWLEAYAGQLVPTNYYSFKYWTREAMEAYGTYAENPYYIPLAELERYGGYATINEAYMVQGNQADNFVANPDRLLILLTGKNTASAAETFVDAAHNLENTLIIGQNTFGMLRSNAFNSYPLPNSGVVIQLGTDLSVFPSGAFQEYVGYQPDLWAAGDAEEAAVRWVKERYLPVE